MEGTRLILVRHGESRAQVDRFVAGHSGCKGLSERGRAQVHALVQRLRRTGELGHVDALYASLMARAQETADILLAALGDVEPEHHCDFCEFHPGEGDGLSWAEFDERYPMPQQDWNPDLSRPDGSETWNQMKERVARGLDMLVERHAGQTVVVACHGGVVVHSVLRWLAVSPFTGEDRLRPAWMAPENASITEWFHGSPPWGNRQPGWQLVRYNDHAHLHDLTFG